MDIDYDIIKTVRELEKAGHSEPIIEKKLGEMGFSDSDVLEIMRLAQSVDSVEGQGKAKTALLALGGGFVVLVVVMAVYALLFT
ncbi:MAG: hypothetical protein KAW41_04915 [Candidatus Diapherotrites archaeon]|nr:hypothetical protein [Candidatus Diapherotrites archaeon]